VSPLPPATAGLVAPTGSVLFLIDGTPAGSATLNNGAATFSSAFPTLAPGPHTVTAVYGGDTNYLPSTSTTAIPVLTGCTQIINGATITGTHTGGLTVPAGGVLCVVSAHVSGGISIGRGASLFLTGSTLAGSVSASNPDRVQLCASTTSTIAVAGASGAVQIGDPSHGCAPNTIHGAVILTRDHGGLTLINNTITGSVTTVANTTQTITGNHH
ncbi:MAG: Ig-like domain-containing protein, partial [Actinomycetota bacterium]|nr:Ig-like domain-containing protein [Actinomycetota bacterium]